MTNEVTPENLESLGTSASMYIFSYSLFYILYLLLLFFSDSAGGMHIKKGNEKNKNKHFTLLLDSPPSFKGGRVEVFKLIENDDRGKKK